MARTPTRKSRKVSVFAETRDKAHELIAQTNLYFVNKPINEIIFVPTAIYTRIIGTHDSIGLLLDSGYIADAAAIVLTQFELRVQLAWTAHDIKNASQWVAHADLLNAPKKIITTINQLFPGETDHKRRLRSIYSHLSGVKHANPVMSELVFSGRSIEGEFSLATGTIEDAFSKRFSRLIHDFSIYQLAWCSQVISLHVAKYAKVDRELRERLRLIGLEHQSSEAALAEFMEEVTKRQQGFLGLRKYMEGRRER